MTQTLPTVDPVTIPILGEEGRFAVRRIYCIGRNYAEHAREMGFDPDREEPFFFLKPTDAIVPSGATIAYPRETHDFQHEIELVVAVGEAGCDIPADRALRHVFGYAVGIDLTRRDLQIAAREKGRPWEIGKAFDQSAPCGPIRRAGDVDIASGRIWLSVNGEIRQDSDIDCLTWSVAEIIASLSTYVELQPGDLIYTGTPAGVGPIVPGDVVLAGIDGVGEIRLTVAR